MLGHLGYILTLTSLTGASRRWFPKQQSGLCTHKRGTDSFWTYGMARTRKDTQVHRQCTTVVDGRIRKQPELANNKYLSRREEADGQCEEELVFARFGSRRRVIITRPNKVPAPGGPTRMSGKGFFRPRLLPLPTSRCRPMSLSHKSWLTKLSITSRKIAT